MALALSSVTATATAAHSSSVDPTFEEETRAHLNCAGSSLSLIYRFHHYVEAALGIQHQALPSGRGRERVTLKRAGARRGARAPLEHGAVF